VMSVGRSVGR